VITTDIGPKAFEIFEQYGITVYRAEGIIDNAIQQLEKGKLPKITKATVLR
ncbi:MAG: NifB/NifX family molybdenum-iron cluster-binding protein, partial [Thermoplasmatales archaeon]